MIQHILIMFFFIGFLIFLGIIGIRNVLSKEDSIGKPPINKFLFIITKLSFVVPWSFAFIGAYKPKYLLSYFNENVAWIGIFLVFIGFVIVVTGYIPLGKQTRFGLPTSKSKLITSGIYKYCRHPMYLGLFMMVIGTTLYFPHWVIIICCIITIALHHQIVIAEEKYMENAFGNEWIEYKKGSKRYLLW